MSGSNIAVALRESSWNHYKLKTVLPPSWRPRTHVFPSQSAEYIASINNVLSPTICSPEPFGACEVRYLQILHCFETIPSKGMPVRLRLLYGISERVLFDRIRLCIMSHVSILAL